MYSAKKGVEGCCCVNLVKNGGLYIGEGRGYGFCHMGGFGWEIGFEF